MGSVFPDWPTGRIRTRAPLMLSSCSMGALGGGGGVTLKGTRPGKLAKAGSKSELATPPDRNCSSLSSSSEPNPSRVGREFWSNGRKDCVNALEDWEP